MKKVIVITSGKGGVGKTTVSANLGRALGSNGKRTVLVEGDVGLNNLDVVLGVEDKIVFDAGEVVLKKATVEQALVAVEKNLYLFPSTLGASNLITIEAFKGIIGELKKSFDCILIDSPAGIEENFFRAISSAEQAIVVVTPHITSVRDGAKTVKTLKNEGIDDVKLIVNRVKGELVFNKTMLSPEEIAQVIKVPLCGVLPEDDFVNSEGLVDVENRITDIGYSFKLISDYLCGVDNKIYNCTVSCQNFKNRLKRWLNAK